ncbi:MAG: Fusaric acid resistance protein-like [Marmoricola sp.]|nr:Fusaric acid resistance protein-like [Marmoricola sp.]
MLGEGTLKQLLHIQPQPGAHRVALRAGLSVLVPLLTVLALGHPEWSTYAVFGAFTSIYGRNHVHLSRLAMQASAGATLVSVVVLGGVVSALHAPAWSTVLAAGLVAALGTMLSTAQDWHPPGPMFLVFAFGAVMTIPVTFADLPVMAVVAGSSAILSLALGNVGGFYRRQRTMPSRLASPWSWQPLRFALAVVMAGGIATALGIGHPYWAMVAAAAPLSARGFTGQLLRAGHRVLGTMLGLVTSAALLALGMGAVTTVLVVAVLQIATELLVGRNYGLAMICITPMALLMGQLAAPRPTASLLFDRGIETFIGAAVAVLVVGAAELRRRRP